MCVPPVVLILVVLGTAAVVLVFCLWVARGAVLPR